MFWADELVKNLKDKQVVNDSSTPSGIVHMGSLKGPVIHDVLFRVLKEKGADVMFMYGFDDFDPIDGLAPNLQEKLGKYMGVPVALAPAPEGSGNFGDYHADKMKSLLTRLGIKPEYYHTYDLYKQGKFNSAIKIVLDNADKVRKVYADTYKKEMAKDWFPFQVLCPNCGKIGTTKVTAWDGKEVQFKCLPDLVKWAKGCGHIGFISPYDGNGKMPWKVEWAAKWFVFGITVEGAGKDHASAGGSYDIAMKIAKEVFECPRPIYFGYEFFLSHGKKMSSSKGLGLTGEQLLEVLAPEVARFLMIKTPPNRAVEFTPKDTYIIPDLYDDFIDGASFFTTRDVEGRAFELSNVFGKEFFPWKFLKLAQLVQLPNAQSQIEKDDVQDWAKYAKYWVENFAPEEDRHLVSKDIPDVVQNLTEEQKKYLTSVVKLLEKDWQADELQQKLYDLSKELNIPTKDAFAAIYLVLIGKTAGPKAGAFLLENKELAKKRFEEISSNPQRHSRERGNPGEIPEQVGDDD